MRRCHRGPFSGFVALFMLVGFLIFTSKLTFDDSKGFSEDGEAVPFFGTVDGWPVVNPNLRDSPSTDRTIAKSKAAFDRHVTPSLAELANMGSTTPEVNEHAVMITRVPGAGAEILVLILQKLQGLNAFKHIRLPPDDQGQLTDLQQELLVEEISSIVRQEAIPLSFDGDVRFLNFTQFDRQAPAYISLIRDPLDPRTLERFKRGESATVYKGSISHFCGHDPRCSKRNDIWALKQAKETVSRWYHVIGVLDHMKETLMLLENRFPYFFEGASVMYDKLRPKKIHNFNETTVLKPVSRKRLKIFLKTELHFYNWIKKRLLNQTSRIKSNSVEKSRFRE